MKEKYLAHNKNAAGEVHNLNDHLKCVGNLAKDYIYRANINLAETAQWAGLLHDLGKYREEFQSYLKSEGKIKSSTDNHHAVYGAALAFVKNWNLLAFVIAGHHAGLHNFEDLKCSIKKPDYRIQTSNVLDELKNKFEDREENLPPFPQTFEEIDFIKDNFRFEFAARMIFSALIDADRYDTARHANCGIMPETPKLDPTGLLKKLEEVRQEKSENARKNGIDEKLLNLRNQIFDDCLREAEKERGFFSLTVPTGGAKTLAAMAFALKHCEFHNKLTEDNKLRRIIVVIPYLSIIEQNAKEYRKAFGDDVVIENHSAVEVEEKPDDDDDINPLTLITENWDAPVIVTTSVQFIESLFARQPSKCRKLHNIANSVVIFDEIQTLPAKLLDPLFSVWRELKENYGVSFVFSTATQPAFRRQNNFTNGFAENDEKHPLREITSNTEQIYKDLNRVNYDFSEFKTPRTWSQIADEMRNEPQILCVVNTRKHAFELWNELTKEISEPRKHGIFHLSSAMCAEHRLQTIAEIKQRLADKQDCQVVSTQLVEAGVDLDFPVLFRAIAPLDSIVQAAGRCNREGKLEKGRVKVFMPENNNLPKGIYKNATEITCTMNLNSETLANDYEIFSKYFQLLYQSNNTDQENIQKLRNEMQFKTVSEKAKVIDREGIGVIVQFEKSSEIIEEIRNRGINKNKHTDFADFKREDWRKLQRFTVNIWEKDFENLQKLGQIQLLLEDKKLELYVLDIGSYHKELGVLTNERPTNDFLGGM